MMVTCLIGDPVEHSVSDIMYNYFAKRVKMRYSHVKFRVDSKNESNLKLAINALGVLGITGANITIPYKVDVIKFLDYVDSEAKYFGAVNTIINKNGRLNGYNTDGKGAIAAMEKKLRKIKPSDKVLILGCGGTARSIIFEIYKKTKNLTILNRSFNSSRMKKVKSDFREYRLRFLPLTERNIINEIINANFVLNTTPVGMYPNTNSSILSESMVSKIDSKSSLNKKYFFDAVFNPYFTKFLKTAKSHGAKVCSGLYMMVYQGAESFKLWTGKRVSAKDIKAAFELSRTRLT